MSLRTASITAPSTSRCIRRMAMVFILLAPGAAMWGNYRSLEPLHLLLDPQEQVDLVRSFLTLFERTGRMMAINRGLSGHHIIAVALDAYMKGYRDFDVAKAYE